MKTKTFHVDWTEIARHDLEEIADFVFRQDPDAALRLVESIERKAATLESLPQRGRIPPELVRFRVELYREILIPPYRLLYRVRAKAVAVLGIFDGRRDLEDALLGRLLSL